MLITHPVRLACFCLLVSSSAFAQPEVANTLAGCAGIVDNDARLACFDRLAARDAASRERALAPAAASPAQSGAALAVAAQPGSQTIPGALAKHWELLPETKRGTFNFQSHQDNYIVAAYSHAPNGTPYLPFRRLTDGSVQLSHTELAFQLGFKMKLLENPADTPVDLWMGYTQQSFWQAYNSAASSPFRETNYQPELMAVMPVDFGVLGMRARFLNLGMVHQSNGQSSTLSRSWNRIYAQLGLENGDFTLVGRVWKRLHEAREDDDNPDILAYMGHGDLTASYWWRGHRFSMLGRHNFHSNRGAAQLSWAFPLAARLKGYVQLFSGYGQSLIDYNYYQRSIGVGVMVAY
jgi:phospholipase A1